MCPCSRKALCLPGHPGWQRRNAGRWRRAISEHAGAPGPTQQQWHRPQGESPSGRGSLLRAPDGENKAAGDGFGLVLRRKKQGRGRGELCGPPGEVGTLAQEAAEPPRSILGARRQPKASTGGKRGVERRGRSPAAPTQRSSWSQPTSTGRRVPQHPEAAERGRALLARGGFCTLAPPCRNNSLSPCLLAFITNSVRVFRGRTVYRHFASL